MGTKDVKPADVFNFVLRIALERFDDPIWLGQHSHLATPYFLGHHLKNITDAGDARERGQVLQAVIQNAATELWSGTLPMTRKELVDAVNSERSKHGNKGRRYLFYLLELRFLRQYFSPRTHPKTVRDIPDFVNVSETRFYEHLKQAITELGNLLLKRIHPTFRLESPSLATKLIGRDTVVEAVLSDLQGKRSVAVSGGGGVGKTSLGTAVLTTWPTEAVFWFTFRPGLNDNLGSILFSLGHFFSQWGRSSLWLQLLANEGQITNIDQALGFLREDLQAIRHTSPLLCFDEVDLLQTASKEPRQKEHIQVLEFLESLHELAPLLLIGQRALIDTDAHYALQPLTTEAISEFLSLVGVNLNDGQLQQLQQYTNGNPRLLELYVALSKSGDELINIFSMDKAASVQPLFNRLWKRLDQSERQLLSILSVFRTYAPLSIWPEDSVPLDSLIERRLIKVDKMGGITLLNFFRRLVYREQGTRRRQQLHHRAALVRAQLGEYTAAAYHYSQAGDYTTAVRIWYPNKDREILRGQAIAAYDIFQSLTPDHLEDDVHQELKVIQDRLYLLSGEAQRILESIENFKWHPDKEITADIHHQWGRANTILGQTDAALSQYEDAINVLVRLTTKTMRSHLRRGQIFMEQVDLQAARREAHLARYEAELMEGLIDAAAGDYEQARFHSDTALHLAHVAEDEAKIARAHYWLATIAGKQERIDLAKEHALIAMSHFEAIGDRLQLEQTRAELAGMYLNVRRFDEVIEPAEKALRFFERIKHDRLISVITSNLAEAYLETGAIAKAKEYAFRVLQFENPRSRPYALYTLGHVHEKQNVLDNAETCFKEGIQIAKQNEDKFIEAYLQRSLGQVYRRLQQHDQAENRLQLSFDLFERMELESEIIETKKLLHQ